MIALLFLRGGPFLLLVFRIVVKISSALNRFTGSFKFSKRKSLKRSRTIQEMSSVENAMNFPKFLYSGVVKKLHKRNQTKYQKRRLEFYPDRVDYFKIDSDKRCGTIPIQGVRVEIRPQEEHNFEFVFDDMKARQYVFMCESDVVKASMLWIANGEQHNNYGPTLRKLRPSTLEYMNSMKTHNIIRELILKKYKQAATFFISGQGLAREYEDADSVGIERMVKTIPTDTSSSDDESLGSSTPSTSKQFQNRSRPQSLKMQPDMVEKEGYITSNAVHPLGQDEKQQKFSAQRGTPSLELSEDDPDYMSFPQLRGLKCQLDSIDHSQKPDVPKRSSSGKYPQENQASGRRVMSNRPDVMYSIAYHCNNDDIVDFGSREVNAVKARIRGQADFIELDLADLGQTFEELKFSLCNEFDIDKTDIVCIRKLPDVRITNDKDVRRIRAGRKLEIEIQDT